MPSDEARMTEEVQMTETQSSSGPRRSLQLLRLRRGLFVLHSAFLLLGSAPLPPFPPSAHAHSYAVDWSTIDGGGGTSTGGVYSLSGTVGEPAAGTLTGGTFA